MLGKIGLLLSVGLFCGNLTFDKLTPEITSIQTSYPVEDDGVDERINVPNHSTELEIRVNALHTKQVKFYSQSREPDSFKQLLTVDTDPTDGFYCRLNYQEDEGFSRKIIMEAISNEGAITSKSIIVNKMIDQIN